MEESSDEGDPLAEIAQNSLMALTRSAEQRLLAFCKERKRKSFSGISSLNRENQSQCAGAGERDPVSREGDQFADRTSCPRVSAPGPSLPVIF